MTNLEQQLQALVAEAPRYGVPSLVMQQGIIPILKLLAQQLQHPEYYILETPNQNWLLTTLSKRDQPQLQKKVIYAFASLNDAAIFAGKSEPGLVPKPMPIADILFRLFALPQADSIIFLDRPGNFNNGTEIQRSQLQTLIQQQLQKLVPPTNKSNPIPPNLA